MTTEEQARLERCWGCGYAIKPLNGLAMDACAKTKRRNTYAGHNYLSLRSVKDCPIGRECKVVMS